MPRNAHGYWLAAHATPTGKRGNAPGKGNEKMWAWVSVAYVKVRPLVAWPDVRLVTVETRNIRQNGPRPSRALRYGLSRRKYRTTNVTKPNSITIALAPSSHNNLVAIFDEVPRFATANSNGIFSFPTEFQQATERIRRRAANGAGTHQITCLRVAAGHGVVRQLLRHGPVHVFEIGTADRSRDFRICRF